MSAAVTALRVQEAMNDAQVDQQKLAEELGVSQGSISKIVRGQTANSRLLPRIAWRLRKPLPYLLGETDDPDDGAFVVPTPESIAEQLDLVPIVEIDQDYGMGGSFIADYVEEQQRWFPRTWIETFTTAPPQLLTLARGKGDSMDPTIRDRDIVIIDRSRTRLDEQDAIWALSVGEIGMIKRLRARGQSIVIKSDNERVNDEEVSGDEVTLVGRVVFIGRRM